MIVFVITSNFGISVSGTSVINSQLRRKMPWQVSDIPSRKSRQEQLHVHVSLCQNMKGVVMRAQRKTRQESLQT